MQRKLTIKFTKWLAERLEEIEQECQYQPTAQRLKDLILVLLFIANAGLWEIAQERNQAECQNQPAQSTDAA